MTDEGGFIVSPFAMALEIFEEWEAQGLTEPPAYALEDSPPEGDRRPDGRRRLFPGLPDDQPGEWPPKITEGQVQAAADRYRERWGGNDPNAPAALTENGQ